MNRIAAVAVVIATIISSIAVTTLEAAQLTDAQQLELQQELQKIEVRIEAAKKEMARTSDGPERYAEHMRRLRTREAALKEQLQTTDYKAETPKPAAASDPAVGSAPAERYHTPEEKRDVGGIELMPGVSAGVVLELEAGWESQGSESSSDIVLATFEFGIEAEISDLISGSALLLWEEDDTEPVDLDEAVITLTCPEGLFTLDAGKLYLPFGNFNSHVVSDPITVELAEARESGAVIGYESGIVSIQAALFNGDLDEEGDDDVDGVSVALTVAPAEGIEAGVYWVSDIGESGGIEGLIAEVAEEAEEAAGEAVAYSEVAGFGGYVCVQAGDLAFDVEYIAAADDFAAGLLADKSLSPSAWNAELAFQSIERWEFAVKVEGSDEFPGFPETQFGGAIAFGIDDNAAVKVEYLHGTFEGDEDDRDIVTGQLSVEF